MTNLIHQGPYLIEGGISVDDRGVVTYNNLLKLSEFERQYFVQNHKSHFIRAWHGHKKEKKVVSVVQGSAMVCCVKIDDWNSPSRDLEIQKFYLTNWNTRTLVIPGGYANGFINFTKNTILHFLSTSTLEQSLNDDIRFESGYWNPWEIVER